MLESRVILRRDAVAPERRAWGVAWCAARCAAHGRMRADDARALARWHAGEWVAEDAFAALAAREAEADVVGDLRALGGLRTLDAAVRALAARGVGR